MLAAARKLLPLGLSVFRSPVPAWGYFAWLADRRRAMATA